MAASIYYCSVAECLLFVLGCKFNKLSLTIPEYVACRTVIPFTTLVAYLSEHMSKHNKLDLKTYKTVFKKKEGKDDLKFIPKKMCGYILWGLIIMLVFQN